jgi:hypothetical protein
VDFRALNTDGAYRSNGKFDPCISGHGPPLSAANLHVAADCDRKSGMPCRWHGIPSAAVYEALLEHIVEAIV